MNKRVLLTFVLNVAALWLLAQSSGTLNGHEFVDLGLTVKKKVAHIMHGVKHHQNTIIHGITILMQRIMREKIFMNILPVQ